MAKSVIITFALIFSSILIFALIAESRPTPTATVPIVICTTIHGVDAAETCTSIAARFSVEESHFLEINPNINCNSIFVGQWVCVEGKVV